MRRREREQVSRRLGVARFGQLRELANRFVIAFQCDEHPSQVESGEPERRLTVAGLAIRGSRFFEAALALEDLPEVVVGLRVTRVDRNRLPVSVGSVRPSLLQAEQHAVVVMRVAEIEAERHDRAIVLFGLRPVALPAIERDEVRMRLSDRRIDGQRRFVRGDCAGGIASLREPESLLEPRLRIVAQRADAAKHRIVDCRPARSVLLMTLERSLRFVLASERSIRQRKDVVRGAPFRKERHRALEMPHRRVMLVSRRGDPGQTKFRSWLGRRLVPQRLEQRLCAIEIADVEERLGELHARREIVWRHSKRLLQTPHRFVVSSETLQHDRIEIQPLERARRERLRADVRLVGGAPLLPCLQRLRELTYGIGVSRSRVRDFVHGRHRLARGSWVGIEGEMGQRRQRCLRRRRQRHRQAHEEHARS